MSILLEALKQKNQRAKNAVAADAISESPSLSLVDVEKEKQDGPSESNDKSDEPMQTLVSMLSIEPPAGLDWQLKQDISTQPISLMNEKLDTAPESSSFAQENLAPLAFELILPTNAVTPAPMLDVKLEGKFDGSLELETAEIPVVSEVYGQSIEEVLPTESLNFLDPKEPLVSEEPRPIVTTEQPVEIPISSAEPVSEPKTIDDGSLAEAEAKQSTSSELSLPTLDKSPLSAKRFLSFSRRAVPVSESKQSLVKESAQPKKHQPSSYKVRQPILIVGGVLIGFGAVGYATLVAWEAQQESHMQQMAHYKSLALTELPETSEPIEGMNSEIGDSESSSFVTSNADLDNEPAPTSESGLSSMPVVQDSAAKEKPVKVLAEAEKQKVSQFSQTQGVLDTNRATNDHRVKSAKVNIYDLPQMSLQQTQATGDLLVSAYQAWQLGQVTQAEQLYRQLLEKQPQQRDALLGMLAVSQVNGSDRAVVLGYAEQLRRLYPHDREVRLATDRLQGEASRDRPSETALKLAQQSSANVAEASYRLGLFYVEQQRWAEAQSAFFEAVSKKPYQVDYRLNLAISYDQLGKHRLAVEHYQEALSLANLGLTKVDQRMIHERLAYLQSYRSAEN